MAKGRLTPTLGALALIGVLVLPGAAPAPRRSCR